MIMDERLKEAPCGFISMDRNCIILEVNNTFLEWMHYTREDLLGKHIESLFKPVNKMIFHSYFYPNINLYGYVEEFLIKFKNRAGEDVPYLMNAKRFIQGDMDHIDCILVQMKKRMDYELELRMAKKQLEAAYLEKEEAFLKLQQINFEIDNKQRELMEMNMKLEVLSNTDALTGIPNRRFFEEHLKQYIELYRKEGQVFSVLIIDIDYFKKINDTYGHQVGDLVLVELAKFLKYHLQQQGIVTRFGGEEFLILLPQTNVEQAMEVARQINQKVEKVVWKEVGSLTVSVGVATFTEEDTEMSIVKKADQALYVSKKNGRNYATHFMELR